MKSLRNLLKYFQSSYSTFLNVSILKADTSSKRELRYFVEFARTSFIQAPLTFLYD